MTTKFKSRYVLGEGYPRVCWWSMFSVTLFDKPNWYSADAKYVKLDYPEELQEKASSDKRVPYRLVLERVDE